jgi:NTP pyrophosphatase (non-canonical NTP hydrolase)
MTITAQQSYEVVVAYQSWQDKTSWYAHSGERDTMEMTYIALGVAGEAGESAEAVLALSAGLNASAGKTADAIKKGLRTEGDQAWENMIYSKRLALAMEVGDVMWYVVRFCTFFGITVEELMLLNIVKLYKRLNERTESGLKEISWPLTGLSYEGASNVSLQIEHKIMHPGENLR